MASKRGIRRKVCDGKVKHETSHDARQALYYLFKSGKGEGNINVYRCKFCKKYHIGHTSWRCDL